MNYFKDENGNVFAYYDEQVADGLAYDKTPMAPTEVDAHLNPAPTSEQLANEARIWRDAELTRADIELNKVQDGMGIGTVTQWRSYRVALRNWPTTDGWPESTKPAAPDYKE